MFIRPLRILDILDTFCDQDFIKHITEEKAQDEIQPKSY